MAIAVTGGGSGGHITPILAVARELKQLKPDVRIVYISQQGDSLDDVVWDSGCIDEMHSVAAGKFRRYNGEGLRQLLDFETMRLNIRDGFRIIRGLWQSFWLLRRIRPDIIFTRGSYVSVPVTLAGAVQSIPYVTHDSDTIPSLTNRLIARWASLHAVAQPEELYSYPIDKTVTVGVPISEQYQPVTAALQRRYRRELKLDSYEQILLVTGGGLGAQSLNTAVIQNAAYLLAHYPRLVIVHLTGRANEAAVQAAYQAALQPASKPAASAVSKGNPAAQAKADSASNNSRVIIKGFAADMYRYTGAATVVIARAGATNLAELAVQAKTCIIVPNPLLTGGHQLKNTAALRKRGAIIEMTEDQIAQERRLAVQVAALFDNLAQADDLARNLATFARPDAAKHIASLLLHRVQPPTNDPPPEPQAS